jgi:hypothetical protein
MITITAPRTRCSASPPDPFGSGSAARWQDSGAARRRRRRDPGWFAHKSEGASPDLVVVGAYPGGRSPDIRKPSAQERERSRRNITAVALPAYDPVYGKSGPLLERWRGADRS